MKAKEKNNKDILEEYDFSNGIRGKHYKKMQEGFTVTVYNPDKETYLKNLKEKVKYFKIDEDVLQYFRNSEEINNALRTILSVIPKNLKSVV